MMANTITNFFHMGGYGIYIWISYAMGLLVIALNLLLPLWQHQKLIKTISKKIQQQRDVHETYS